MNNTYKDGGVPEDVVKTVNWYIDNLNTLKVTDPIYIPSKGNRPKAITHLLEEFGDAEVYVFCYKEEYEEKGYDKLKLGPNCHIVQIEVPWRSLQQKRVWIQEWSRKRGVKRYFMMDDDLSIKSKIANISREGPAKLDIKLPQLFAIMQHYFKDRDFSIASTSIDTAVAFCSKLETQGSCYCMFYVNDELLQSKGISWDPDPAQAEDMIMNYTCFKNNIPGTSLMFMCYQSFYKNDFKNSVASKIDNYKRFIVKTWINCKGFYVPAYDSKNDRVKFRQNKKDNREAKFNEIYAQVGDSYDKLLEYVKKQNQKTEIKPFWSEK